MPCEYDAGSILDLSHMATLISYVSPVLVENNASQKQRVASFIRKLSVDAHVPGASRSDTGTASRLTRAAQPQGI